MSFVLSPFQQEAIQGIQDGKHVFVTAHTGSGKTLPAEYAIDYFTKQGKKVIYTSPIKALSNQKYSDFSKKYTHLEVGLLTGDNKHNPGANILIMTTEILYHKCANKHIDVVSHVDFDMNIETELGCVIFDEAHYINDAERGTIWEQCIMLLPNSVQMVLLSATIGNVEYISDWMTDIKGKEVVICGTNQRVVPLEYYQYFTTTDKNIMSLPVKLERDLLFQQYNTLTGITDTALKTNQKCNHLLKHTNVHRSYVVNQLCKTLRAKEMFPALFFVFSRKKVEEYAAELTTPLFEPNEKDYKVAPICRQLLVSRVANWKEYILLPEYEQYVNLLEKGIGIHHAGMLPIFREMIEILYEQKYIKVLFATETFAVGLNMPTKTVCFTSLHKHDGKTHRRLHNHEFKQMCGRAGRRNIDTVGYVILLTNLFKPMDLTEYKELLAPTETKIKSKFKINYSFVLKHCANYTKDECIAYVKKSLMYRDIQTAQHQSLLTLEQYNQENPPMDETLIRLCREYESFATDMVPPKKRKENHKRRKEYELKHDILNHLILYNKKKEIETHIHKEQHHLVYIERFVENQIQSIYNLLVTNAFMAEDKITPKGMMACGINEFHLLAFVDLYEHTNGFSNYTSTTLYAVLSCFCELKCDCPSVNDPALLYIQDRLNYYETAESNLYGTTEYALSYVMYPYIPMWMDQCNDEASCLAFMREFTTQNNLNIGDFVKSCLALVKLSNELATVCEYTKDYACLEKIKNGQQKLLKFIMNNQSLYV